MIESGDKYLVLNPEELEQRKIHNREKIYIRDIPARRLIGFVFIMFGVVLHKFALLTRFSWVEILIFCVVFLCYNAVSFGLVYLFFTRIKRFNIAELFLFTDLICHVFAIYISGDVKSLFFILLITRTADHVFVSFKKTILYNHLSILSYCGLLLFLVLVEEKTVFWPIESLKLIIVYCVNWYISTVARMTDAFKFKLKAIINAGQNELKKRIRAESQLQEKNKHLEELNASLKDSMDNIKALHGLLPICASCKKIRDDKGYWNQLESYIEKHSDAEFSHGLCEECSDEMYGKYEWYQKGKKDGRIR